MSRIATLLLAGFLVGALFIVPNPRGVSPEDEVTPLPPAFAVCLVQEGGGRTTEITTGTFDPGPLQTTLFSGGRVVGSIGATLDAYEASVVPVVDITAVGTVVGLGAVASWRLLFSSSSPRSGPVLLC